MIRNSYLGLTFLIKVSIIHSVINSVLRIEGKHIKLQSFSLSSTSCSCYLLFAVLYIVDI